MAGKVHTQAWQAVVSAGMAGAVKAGAQACVAHWQAQGEAELLADAEARLARVLAGEADEVDIEGALDWLEELGEVTQPQREKLGEAEALWAHDEQSAWELVSEVLAERGHDEFSREDVLSLLGSWAHEALTAEAMARLIEDYEDR